MLQRKRRRTTEEDREREIARAREKQRKKMIRTRYGQKQKKHARKGVQSCGIAAAAVLLTVWLLSLSFRAKGDVGILTGIMGFFVLLLACKGLSCALKGFKERDKNYITCRVGAGVSGALLLCMCGIFIRGLF